MIRTNNIFVADMLHRLTVWPYNSTKYVPSLMELSNRIGWIIGISGQAAKRKATIILAEIHIYKSTAI